MIKSKNSLKKLFIFIPLSFSLIFAPQDASSSQDGAENDKDFILTSANTKQKYVSFGKMATIDEVCDLLNHPIFNSVDLPSKEEMFPNEYNQFMFNQKFLEVPIDSIIDEFISKIPFDEKSNSEFLIGRSYQDHAEFMYYLKQTFYSYTPVGAVHSDRQLDSDGCLPVLINISMNGSTSGHTDAIEWWSDTKKYKSYGHQFDSRVEPNNPCLFCIFFIREFHDDLNKKFDSLLAANNLLREELLNKAIELKIRDEKDRKDNSLNNQSFKIAEEINVFERKNELEDLVEELKQVMSDELVLNSNSRISTSEYALKIDDADYLDAKRFPRKRDSLKQEIIEYRNLIQNEKNSLKWKEQLEDLIEEVNSIHLEYASLPNPNNLMGIVNPQSFREADYINEYRFNRKKDELEGEISLTQRKIKDRIAQNEEFERQRKESIAIEKRRLEAELAEKERLARLKEQRELEAKLKRESDTRKNRISLALDILFMVFVIFSAAVSEIGMKGIIKGLKENLTKQRIGENLKRVRIGLINKVSNLLRNIKAKIRALFMKLYYWIYPSDESDKEEMNSEKAQRSQTNYDDKKQSKRQKKKRSSKRTKSNKAKKSYYEILGISTNASQADIKKAYQRLAMKYHPDRNKAKNASEKFKEIQKAFQTLSDPNERSKYDRKL